MKTFICLMISGEKEGNKKTIHEREILYKGKDLNKASKLARIASIGLYTLSQNYSWFYGKATSKKQRTIQKHTFTGNKFKFSDTYDFITIAIFRTKG